MTVRVLRCAVAVMAVMLAPAWGSATARPPGPCEHLPAGWVRGFDFTSWERDGYGSDAAGRSFSGLVHTGANAVALVATQYQASAASNAVAADPRRTPSDDALRAAVARARGSGLRVRLRVLVDRDDGGSRAAIAPADPDAWFASYGARVLHYAELAEALGVEELEVGAELGGVTTEANAGRWRALVEAVRRVFHGRVAYSANWDEYGHVSWWDALDEIAIDAYFPLATGPGPSEDAVVEAWNGFLDAGGVTHRWLDEIEAVATAFDRPVVFAELGYPSAAGALAAPWHVGSVYSADEQETGLVAAFRALAGRPWFRGLYIWQWSADPSAGGPGDTDHTVQGKPSEDTVAAWFRAASPNPCAASPQTKDDVAAAR